MFDVVMLFLFLLGIQSEKFDYTVTNVQVVENHQEYYAVNSVNGEGVFFTDENSIQDLETGDKISAYFEKDNYEGLLFVIER
jgi:Cu/Ag efflux protein CusF